MDLHLKIVSSDTGKSGPLTVPAGARNTTEIDINDLDPADWNDTGDAADVISTVITTTINAHRQGPIVTVAAEALDDETLSIVVDGEEVGTFNHDEHGTAGMDAAVTLARAIAEKCGAKFEDNR